jgi:hypothetical protein
MTNSTRRRWGVNVTPRPLFTPGKTRYPFYRKLGGPQGQSGQVRKISPPLEFDPRIAQSISSRYTDYATRSIFGNGYGTVITTRSILLLFFRQGSVRRSLHFVNFCCYWHTSYEVISSSQIYQTVILFEDLHYCVYIYTGCPRRKGQNFGRVFLLLKYTDITQNTYIQSWTVTEIMVREKCGLLAGPCTVPVSWQDLSMLVLECGVWWQAHPM